MVNTEIAKVSFEISEELPMQSVCRLPVIGSHCSLNHPTAVIKQTPYLITHLHDLIVLYKVAREGLHAYKPYLEDDDDGVGDMSGHMPSRQRVYLLAVT